MRAQQHTVKLHATELLRGGQSLQVCCFVRLFGASYVSFLSCVLAGSGMTHSGIGWIRSTLKRQATVLLRDGQSLQVCRFVRLFAASHVSFLSRVLAASGMTSSV